MVKLAINVKQVSPYKIMSAKLASNYSQIANNVIVTIAVVSNVIHHTISLQLKLVA